MTTDDQARAHWDRLHTQPRFRPRYPNDHVVRFVMSSFGGDAAGRRAIDIGVGGGRHTHLLCELGFEVAGIDISSEGLRRCNEWLAADGHRADLREASMDALPFADGSFDLAVSYGVMYYADGRGMDRAIAEMHRVLAPGGRGFAVIRTTDDYRFGKGDALDRNTFRLTIDDTNEHGAIMHFVSADEVPRRFAAFSEVTFERSDTTFRNRTAVNSDWLVQLRK